MPPIIPMPLPPPILGGGEEVVMSEGWAIALGAFAIISLILIGIMIDNPFHDCWDTRSRETKKKDKKRRR